MRPQITNDELIEALGQKAERMGITPTEAVRIAIRNFCKNDMDIEENEEDEYTLTRTSDLLDDEDMRSIHQAIWRIGQPAQEDIRRAPLSSAKSVLAQLMGVSKDAVQELYIKPLARKQILDVNAAASSGEIYVVDPNAPVMIDQSDDEALDTVTTDHDPDDTEERMQELDNAEPVRADGGEKINSDDEHSDDNEETTAA